MSEESNTETNTETEFLSYCNVADVYRISGIDSSKVSEDDVKYHIEESQFILDNMVGTTFLKKEYEWEIYGDNKSQFFLPKYPIISIVSIEQNGEDITDKYDYDLFKKTGLLNFHTRNTLTRFDILDKLIIKFEYGYNLDLENKANFTELNYIVRKITAILTARNILIQQIGGTSDDITSYSLPELQASKGEPYTNIRATIKGLQDELNYTIKNNQNIFKKRIMVV